MDTLAASQMLADMGKNYKVVSVPSGAQSASKALSASLDFLESFETVALNFDNDKAGQDAVQAAKEVFSVGKLKIMSLPVKDANDLLLSDYKNSEYYKALLAAKTHRPDGIIEGKDTWEIIKKKPNVRSLAYPEDWKQLNYKTYGIRLGELDTWTSGSGMGKTQVLRELQRHIFKQTEENIGIIALEEPVEDTVEALMSLEMNKRIHLPDVRETVTEEEMFQAWKATWGTNRIHCYDHFGSMSDSSLMNKIRYMAKVQDCKYIFLDHLSIVVSEFASEGGERELIDTIMTRLKKLTQELNIWIGLVVHLRKTTQSGKSFEEGAVPTLDDLRGSGSIKQLSNSVYALSRNQQAENEHERNTSLITVLKCRFTGRTGGADKLYFDELTGRMGLPTYKGEEF